MWTPYCNITKNMTTTEFTEVNKGKIYNLVEKWAQNTRKPHTKEMPKTYKESKTKCDNVQVSVSEKPVKGLTTQAVTLETTLRLLRTV